LLARARRIFYADRTLEHLVKEWEEAIGTERLQWILRASGEGITDIKAADARAALAVARDTIELERRELCDGVR
jgi:hypothetical protein